MSLIFVMITQKKFEQVIYRGITEGKSSNEIREELVHQAGMSSDKAAFIARDQTGTIFRSDE